jgi:hypothetical protein
MVNKKAEISDDEKNNPRKRKRLIPTRTAGTPANPAFNNPADELFAEAFAHRPQLVKAPSLLPATEEALITLPTRVSRETLLTLPSHGQTEQKKSTPVSPENNYQKVTNTITREAIPQGLFKPGKSKQVYDVLYGLTRGAISPKRTIKISKPKLRKLSGVGARTTMDACLTHLEHVGLVRQQINDGGFHEGNEYEIFTPEEITLLTTPRQGNPGYPAENLGRVGSLDSRHARQGSQPIAISTSTTPKTSLKTNTKSDDEVRVSETFFALAKRFDEATKKITGKGVSKTEAAKWANLADLLILELEVAASRSDGVSSVPAFLTEVLRRQFFMQRQQQSSTKASKTKPDTVGKSESGSYEIKPLDEKGRETALEQLREFAADDFLQDFQKWYTPEDWEWLVKELKVKM